MSLKILIVERVGGAAGPAGPGELHRNRPRRLDGGGGAVGGGGGVAVGLDGDEARVGGHRGGGGGERLLLAEGLTKRGGTHLEEIFGQIRPIKGDLSGIQ